jgi:putative salt-induced outer membrane protein YdiY
MYAMAAALGLAASAAFGQVAPTASTPAPTNSTPWTGLASAGLTLTRGNSRTLLAVAKVLADKKWDAGINELALGADVTYGSSDVNGVDSTTANQEHAFAQYNRLFTPRFYGYARVEGLHDEIANISYRLTVGPGVGYYIMKETNNTFRAEIGTAYINEKDHNDGTHSYETLRLAENFEHKFKSKARIWESVEVLPQVDKFSNYILNAEAGVESSLSKTLSQQTYVQDSYHSDPAPGRLKNDVKFVAAIAYKF